MKFYPKSLKMNKLIVYFLLITVVFASCIEHNPPHYQKKQTIFDSSLININRKLVRQSQFTIKQYIKHKGWQMDSTPTGIWYMFYHKTNNYKPKDGDKVTIKYTVRLLNGKLCYSSDSSGEKTFTINHSAIISGLNEAVQLMPLGSKAVFIIPPYRAYGLTGDGQCIPPNSIIIYDIYLTNIQRAKSNLNH